MNLNLPKVFKVEDYHDIILYEIFITSICKEIIVKEVKQDSVYYYFLVYVDTEPTSSELNELIKNSLLL